MRSSIKFVAVFSSLLPVACGGESSSQEPALACGAGADAGSEVCPGVVAHRAPSPRADCFRVLAVSDLEVWLDNDAECVESGSAGLTIRIEAGESRDFEASRAAGSHFTDTVYVRGDACVTYVRADECEP